MSVRRTGTSVSSKKNNEAKGPTKSIFAVAIIAIMVLAYFYVINNRMKVVEEDVKKI